MTNLTTNISRVCPRPGPASRFHSRLSLLVRESVIRRSGQTQNYYINHFITTLQRPDVIQVLQMNLQNKWHVEFWNDRSPRKRGNLVLIGKGITRFGFLLF